jgi:methylthioribulose-1-phosphate dehydratase
MQNPSRSSIQDATSVSGDGDARFRALAAELAEVGKGFYARNWVLGTSGNFSAALSKDPVRLAITATGLDKGRLRPEQFLEIDEKETVIRGTGKPSAETLLHIEIVRERQAGAVLHTHSVWSTVLSGLYAAKGGILMEGLEMLKGLAGVQTHEHREWLPIIPNSQYMAPLARGVSETLKQHPDAHGFLLREHGLYTWGADIDEARRHIEIFEFLMETMVRRMNVPHAI